MLDLYQVHILLDEVVADETQRGFFAADGGYAGPALANEYAARIAGAAEFLGLAISSEQRRATMTRVKEAHQKYFALVASLDQTA